VLRALNPLRRSVLCSKLRAKRERAIRAQYRRGVLLILNAISCRVELQQELPSLMTSSQQVSISPPGNSACTCWMTAAFGWQELCALCWGVVPSWRNDATFVFVFRTRVRLRASIIEMKLEYLTLSHIQVSDVISFFFWLLHLCVQEARSLTSSAAVCAFVAVEPMAFGPRLQTLRRHVGVYSNVLNSTFEAKRRYTRPETVRKRVVSQGSTTSSLNPALVESTVRASIRKVLESSLHVKFPDHVSFIDVSECSNPGMGDYQSNSAMQIFSSMKKQGKSEFRSPRDVAEEIISGMQDVRMFDSVSIAGPGFINFKLTDSFISEKMCAVPGGQNIANVRVVVDFSSPNIAKEMHVGHLRSTIIGDSLCNAFELAGCSTVRVNHVGDWGTQFGMLINFMNENDISMDACVSDLQRYYKDAKRAFDSDENFKQRSKDVVVKLQSYDPVTIEAWKKICAASRQEFRSIYDRLNIHIEEKGESFYNDMIPSVLDELVEKEVIVEDKGALCIFAEPGEAPVICRKSDGGFNYASTDLAAINYRISHEKAKMIVYVTDQGQNKHFKAIFKTAEAAGWVSSDVALKHVGFGVVLGEDGKRLRTRSGDTIKLKALLDEAEERCLEFLQTKDSSLPTAELKNVAHILGMSSVKYADLHNNRTTNYTFSFDRMLDLKGNTAMYLQYSHARVATILHKLDGTESSQLVDRLTISNETERQLALHIGKFNDALVETIEELAPSKMCEYLYVLCTVFNNFYAACRVMGGENESSRILLCNMTASKMRAAFSVLGIEPIDRL